jgi:hypothetical protein
VKKENQLLGSIVINSLHKIDANRQLIYDCMTLNLLHLDHLLLNDIEPYAHIKYSVNNEIYARSENYS